MMESYREMLTYIKSAVTRNYSEKSINKILDVVSTSQNLELLQEFYQTTLSALEEAKNEVKKSLNFRNRVYCDHITEFRNIKDFPNLKLSNFPSCFSDFFPNFRDYGSRRI